jgi:hypothetical protein
MTAHIIGTRQGGDLNDLRAIVGARGYPPTRSPLAGRIDIV